jgi:hypothetical protein
MLRLLSDQNFSGDLVRGLMLRRRDLDADRVQDIGMMGTSDADVLAWAAEHDRVVVTHDRATMPEAAFQRILADLSMPGLIVVNDALPAKACHRRAVSDLSLRRA